MHPFRINPVHEGAVFVNPTHIVTFRRDFRPNAEQVPVACTRVYLSDQTSVLDLRECVAFAQALDSHLDAYAQH